LGVILIITIPTAIFIVNILTPKEPAPFTLDDAPQGIRDIQSRLQQKLDSGNFSWTDIPDYVTFCQYIADNSPEVQDLVEGKELTAVLDIDEEGCIIYELADGELGIETSSSTPSEPDITVSMSFDVFVSMVKMEKTPIAAFQNGALDFQGTLSEALNVYDIFNIFNAALTGESIGDSEGTISFQITANQSSLYTPGLTLFPCVEITIQNGTRSMGTGYLFVVDQNGDIIAQMDNTLSSVHKFINSTTVLMGGQTGDLSLWNYQTGTTETLPIPGGHHAFDYNPYTDTFMVLEYAYSDEIWDGKQVLYDVLSEYNRDGELIWQWDAREEYPFNATIHSSLGTNETNHGGADWMHSNSIVWDKEEDVVYLNLRNQDMILKINRATKDIEWSAGRWGSFTVLAANNTPVDSLWAHSHSLELVGPNRFILYDNDLYNPSRPSTMHLENATGYSGFVEFEIDEENKIMQEVWSWRPDNQSYYFPASGGDADRLPNGNTLGLFGDRALLLAEESPVIITEVTESGEIPWELRIPGGNDTYYWVHRLEQFYEAPRIEVGSQSLDAASGSIFVNMSIWNSFKQDAVSNGTLSIIADGSQVHEESFEFQRNWQPTHLIVDLDVAPFNTLKVTVKNQDGLSISYLLLGQGNGGLSPDWVLPLVLLSAVVVAIPVLYLWNKQRNAD
ncbi:MAG: aryl-sulfate sulfotransferase, partial [Candidatus Thorarchaeota archaeon]